MIDHEGEVPNCIDVFISETHSIKIAASIHIKLHQSYLELTPFSLKPYLNYPFSRTLYINIPGIYTIPLITSEIKKHPQYTAMMFP